MKYVILILILSFSAFSEEVKFEKRTIKIGKKEIIVEIAESAIQHERGLMFRKKLTTNTGMLFIFKDSQPRSFWMKNTLIPLSIGYFDENKKLLEYFEMTPSKSIMVQDPTVYKSTNSAMYALEMPKGWFKNNSIKVGDKLDFSK